MTRMVPPNQDMGLSVALTELKLDQLANLLAIQTLKWWGQIQLNVASMVFGMKIHLIAIVSSCQRLTVSIECSEPARLYRTMLLDRDSMRPRSQLTTHAWFINCFSLYSKPIPVLQTHIQAYKQNLLGLYTNQNRQSCNRYAQNMLVGASKYQWRA